MSRNAPNAKTQLSWLRVLAGVAALIVGISTLTVANIPGLGPSVLGLAGPSTQWGWFMASTLGVVLILIGLVMFAANAIHT